MRYIRRGIVIVIISSYLVFSLIASAEAKLSTEVNYPSYKVFGLYLNDSDIKMNFFPRMTIVFLYYLKDQDKVLLGYGTASSKVKLRMLTLRKRTFDKMCNKERVYGVTFLDEKGEDSDSVTTRVVSYSVEYRHPFPMFEGLLKPKSGIAIFVDYPKTRSREMIIIFEEDFESPLLRCQKSLR